jgi:hypothetical protein
MASIGAGCVQRRFSGCRVITIRRRNELGEVQHRAFEEEHRLDEVQHFTFEEEHRVSSRDESGRVRVVQEAGTQSNDVRSRTEIAIKRQ